MKTIEWKLDEKLSKEKIEILRKNNYPRPTDCQSGLCSNYRPSCLMNICNIAVNKCEEF